MDGDSRDRDADSRDRNSRDMERDMEENERNSLCIDGQYQFLCFPNKVA